MDEITLERYPHGIPWKELPGYHTAEMLRRHRDLIEAIRRYGEHSCPPNVLRETWRETSDRRRTAA